MRVAVQSSTTARAEPSVLTGAVSVPLATQARPQVTTGSASNETVNLNLYVVLVHVLPQKRTCIDLIAGCEQ